MWKGLRYTGVPQCQRSPWRLQQGPTAAEPAPALVAIQHDAEEDTRPVTEAALTDGLTGEPAWRRRPSWFVWGAEDRNIPAQALRFMGERAGGKELREIPGAAHALPVSQPGPAADVILKAVTGA